ncbi:hypothetical protein GH714_009166 [Hevea brasiliensis]|uniref:Uncharacterized protein n=1 Tax=Hevea brasiliensis TaxID=3981 RepID=A0A6A6KCV1_HEVBR|nr:hypothetical protein GH714_009166 [Hevea brasiliensis]
MVRFWKPKIIIVELAKAIGVDAVYAHIELSHDKCPNCGNDFQIFKSTLNDELQLCPFCSQPFSVVEDEFVRDSVKFSNSSTTFRQAFGDFSAASKKGEVHFNILVHIADTAAKISNLLYSIVCQRLNDS